MNEAIARAATKMGSAAATNTDCVTLVNTSTYIGKLNHATHLSLCNIDRNEKERQESEKLICARVKPDGPVTVGMGRIKRMYSNKKERSFTI